MVTITAATMPDLVELVIRLGDGIMMAALGIAYFVYYGQTFKGH